MNDAQRRLLNSLCGDLSAQVRFSREHGFVNAEECPDGRRWHKDDFRHAIAGKVKGQCERYMPDWDDPEKQITLATSSLKLTVEEANVAIEMAYCLGANCGVRWSLDSDSNDFRVAA